MRAFATMLAALHVAFSPDNTQMVWVDTQRSTLVLRRVSDGTVTGRIGQSQTNTIYQAAYLPDGVRIATLHADWMVRVWCLSDGELLQEMGRLFPMSSIAMAIWPDSTQAVLSESPQNVITLGQQISLWDLNAGAWFRGFSAFDISISDIAISSDNAAVAAIGAEDSYYTWVDQFDTFSLAGTCRSTPATNPRGCSC